MAGSTIKTSLQHSVTLGSEGYISPLKITAAGTINGSVNSTALYIPPAAGVATIENAGGIFAGHYSGIGIEVGSEASIRNTGNISGGAGGSASSPGYTYSTYSGGIGVDISAPGVSLINSGTIRGGSRDVGRDAGTGVSLGAGDIVKNSGLIAGDGAFVRVETGYGATGVFNYKGTFINSGTVQGSVDIVGTGAAGVNSGVILGGYIAFSPLFDGGYDPGLRVNYGASFHNTGTIIGGAGGPGVSISEGTLINSGLIQAGYNAPQKGAFERASGIVFGGGEFINHGTVIGEAGGTYLGDSGNGVFAATSFKNTGIIVGGAGSNISRSAYSNGGAGVYSDRGFSNSGQISGGTGGNGGQGGVGAITKSSNYYYGYLATNSGAITGGDGGADAGPGITSAGQGGDGIVLMSTISNTGVIKGGVGGNGGSTDGGTGGTGAFLPFYDFFGFTLFNAGTITGGNGANGAKGGSGGTGVFATGYGTLSNRPPGYGYVGAPNHLVSNHGVISGGNGAGNGGIGGIGVYLNYSTLLNSGTVSAGAGAGGASIAVSLNSYSGLIIEKGAVFNGRVVASGHDDVLGLSGTSTAPLAGIGTEFTGFSTIAFEANAQWSISGASAALATGESIVGFTSKDAITLTNAAASSGTVTVATAGTVSIHAGGTIYALDIAGATVGETNFSFGDYTLKESSSPAMSFIAGPAHNLVVADFSALFAPLKHTEKLAASPGLTHVPAAVLGSTHNVFGPEHQAIVPSITLHA